MTNDNFSRWCENLLATYRRRMVRLSQDISMACATLSDGRVITWCRRSSAARSGGARPCPVLATWMHC